MPIEQSSTRASVPSLPSPLTRSREPELEALWRRLVEGGDGTVDGSEVSALDSRGLELLIEGTRRCRQEGVAVRIHDPAPPLLAARRAFQLGQVLEFSGRTEPDPPRVEVGTRLGEVLTELGYLTYEELDSGVEEAEQRPDTYIGQVLLERGYVNAEQLARALAVQHDLPYVDPVGEGVLDVSLDCDVPFAELRVHGILPYLRLGETIVVSLKDPADVYASDVVRKYTGMSVITTVATPEAIQTGLDLIQRASSAAGARAEEKVETDEVSAEDRFNELIVNAIIESASDIHVEPYPEFHLVRYRVDGHLHDVCKFPRAIGNSLVARIKVMAGADISEKRLPQDGRIHFKDRQRDVDLRVNTLPVVGGEKAVMRILDRTTEALKIEQLGIRDGPLDWLKEAIYQPHGMVLVTGPTGSGKTTTLYSVLDEIVNPETNVSTVENPVERSVNGVNQTQVNYKAGLTFELSLRALLRQDPDVIMIGEIRDKETAEIAVEAALTGHLVLATLHTNDAPGAASRLIQMGVEPFLVAATLRAVVAQRLVRRLCEGCRNETDYPPEVMEKYLSNGLDSQAVHFAAEGCASCRQTGYDGRRGVFEVMRADSEVQDMIARNPSSSELRGLALERGMRSLLSDAFDRVNRGITTLEEALRAGGKS